MSEETIYKTEEAAKLSKINSSSLPALAIIGVGILLLAAAIFDFHLIDILWPGFVIAPGLLLMWPAYKATAESPSKLSFLAVPGAMIATVGGLLFVMNITGYFDAWAYSWTLVIAAAVAGLMYAKRFDEDSRVHEKGYKFIRFMGFLFVGMAIFFEIVAFEHFNPLTSLAIIAFGFYMLMKDRKTQKAE